MCRATLGQAHFVDASGSIAQCVQTGNAMGSSTKNARHNYLDLTHFDLGFAHYTFRLVLIQISLYQINSATASWPRSIRQSTTFVWIARASRTSLWTRFSALVRPSFILNDISDQCSKAVNGFRYIRFQGWKFPDHLHCQRSCLSGYLI